MGITDFEKPSSTVSVVKTVVKTVVVDRRDRFERDNYDSTNHLPSLQNKYTSRLRVRKV